MLYYGFQIKISQKQTEKGETQQKTDFYDNRKLNSQIALLNEKQDLNVRFYVSTIRDNCMVLCGAIGYKNNKNVVDMATKFVKNLGFEVDSVEGEEIKAKEFACLVRRSEGNDFIDNEDEILRFVKLEPYRINSCLPYDEKIIPIYKSEKAIVKKADSLFCGNSLKDEITRIFSIPSKKFIGHPVHYILTVDDIELKDSIVEVLTGALYKSNRLKSRRVVTIFSRNENDFFNDTDVESIDKSLLESVYRSIPGGTVVIHPKDIDYNTSVMVRDGADVYDLAKYIKNNHRDCLTILVFGKNEKKSKEKLMSELSDLKFVEIDEDMFYQDKAIEILKEKAHTDGILNIEKLLAKIPEDQERCYYISDVNKTYNCHICRLSG